VNVESLFQEWRSSIDEAAKAKADEVYLREFRKSKKAMLMQEGKDKGHKTGQERESYAYANHEYLELLDALRVATETNTKFQWRMKIAEERIGIYRTHEASKRKEFGNYGN
jgi:hypothetical protein